MLALLALAPPAHGAGFALELQPPTPAAYGDGLVLRGRIVPALVDAPVTVLRDGAAIGQAVTGADGTFTLATRAERPAVYAAVAGALASPPVRLDVRPKLGGRGVGAGIVGGSRGPAGWTQTSGARSPAQACRGRGTAGRTSR